MDDQDKIKLIAEKLKLDVPIIKVIEQNRQIILYLYGGSVIELGVEDLPADPTMTSPPSQPNMNQKVPRKRKVLDGRD